MEHYLRLLLAQTMSIAVEMHTVYRLCVLLVACSLSPAFFKHTFDALYDYLSHVAHLRHNGAHIVISTTCQRRLDECLGCI